MEDQNKAAKKPNVIKEKSYQYALRIIDLYKHMVISTDYF